MTRLRHFPCSTARGRRASTTGRRACGLLLVALLAGCASPANQGLGLIRTSVRGPLIVNVGELPARPKQGVAEVYTFLGLFAYGDGSVEAAMQQGGLTRLNYADFEYESLLGLLAVRRTLAYGD